MEIDRQHEWKKPTHPPVNGKLLRAIVDSQLADILDNSQRYPYVSPYLRGEINSIETIDLIEPSSKQQTARKIFIDQMNA